MRILLIDQFGEMGGAQRCLLEAAMGFHQRGWEVCAALPAPGPFANALATYCAEVRSLVCGPFASGKKSLSDVWRFSGQVPLQTAAISRLVRRFQPDAIYVNGPRVLAA